MTSSLFFLRVGIKGMEEEKDDSTVFITDMHSALEASEKEAQERPAALLVIGGDRGGTLIDLQDGDISVGRNADNTLVLETGGVSRYHFKVGHRDSRWVLQDGGSKNGTFLNNKKIDAPVPLSRGDIIKIGTIALKYIPKGDPERANYDKLQAEAIKDGHTGCYNKTYFNKEVEIHVKRAKISKHPLGLILFDLDHFKRLNDDHGHDAGDVVLKEMANLVHREGVRSHDIFARYGGEEFVILLPKTPLSQALRVAERIRVLIEEYPFTYEGKSISVTASVGVAECTEATASGVDLFKKADAAVYRAKEKGRNIVQCYRD